jgi:hypothetical protein
MRNLILAFTLTILGSINLLSQINVAEREILKSHPTQSILNGDWCSHLEYYRDSIGIESTRSDILDNYAFDRAIYFATVLDHTSRDKRMKDCIHRIPGDNSAHNKLFGNSIFFSAPDTLGYVPAYPSFKEDSYWITPGGEIMQEYVYLLKGKDKLRGEDLISKMIGYHHKNRGDKGILNAYLRSYSHKKIIDTKMNDTYGSSIVYIVHSWFDKEQSLWYQEVTVLNVTAFGRKTYSLRS